MDVILLYSICIPFIMYLYFGMCEIRYYLYNLMVRHTGEA